MTEPGITLANIKNCLDSFNNDLKNCKNKFEKIEDTLVSVKSGFRSKRSEFNDTLKEINCDLLHKLNRVRQFEIDEEYHKEKCKSKRNEFKGVLVKSRKAIDKLLEDIDDLSVDINSQNKMGKENSVSNSEESVDKNSNRVNLFILRCRQTEEAFKLMSMNAGFRHKCNGCNQNIPIQSLYLSHIEEYPAGSKTYIPHSYHITTSCIFQRGFEVDYLKKISVSSDEQISSDIIQVLKEIGFKKKNIQLQAFNTTDSHIKKSNDGDDFPDNVSELSDISNNPSVASSDIATTTFIYHRKHPYQKKSILCHGCKLNIDTETYITLKNGKQFLSFHIKNACLKEGAVQNDDFSQATCKVFKLLKTNNELVELMACGFRYNKIIGYRPSKSNLKVKNTDSHIKKDNDGDNFPDNVSELSDISSNLSVASSDIAPTTFIYRRKHPNQKKSVPCHGCKLKIDTVTYVAFENGKQFLPFHIKEACLKEAKVLPDNFSQVTCKVFNLIQTKNQLDELMACGFRYNKIIGYRPSNSNFKKSLDKHDLNGNKGDNPDCAYIFNEEPFIFERLLHGEKCRGCQNQVRRDEISLRHKERVPRDKLEYSPLISQYYHANKQCLLNRGFTIKYLSLIKCNAILAGDDNLSRITDVLIKCGFYNENIIYNPKGSVEPRGFEVAPQCKLFIENCSNSSSHCEGCGFILIPNQSCFIYALTAIQDSNSKMFHIRNSCLKAHFTKEQLIALTCVTNNNIDVSPNEIINCGIVKIITDNAMKFPGKSKNDRDFKPKFKKLFFEVDIGVDNRLFCGSCKQNLLLDKYFIKYKGKQSGNNQVHLDPSCVRKLGHSSNELAHSRLTYNVSVSPDGLCKLRNCGFRNLPQN